MFNEECWAVECFECDLNQFFLVGFGIVCGLGDEERMLLWGDTKVRVECVVEKHFHVVPVGNNPSCDWILDLEQWLHRPECIVASPGTGTIIIIKKREHLNKRCST